MLLASVVSVNLKKEDIYFEVGARP